MSDRDELAALRRMAELEDKERASVNPTADSSFGRNALEASGKAFTDTGRGIVQRSSQALANAPASLPLLSGINMVLEKVGLSPRETAQATTADIAESRRLDKPLMDTAGGKTGEIGTTALLLAPTAAANTPAAAGIVGSLTGLLRPALSAKEGAINTILGGAGAYAGQWVANKVPSFFQGRIDKAAEQQAAGSQKMAAAQAASKEGYVIPPADLKPGMLTEAVSGLSGKVKTAQVASERNQVVTDRLARQALGLKSGEELTVDALQALRQKAATEGYAPIRSAGTVQADKAFFDKLDDIAAANQGAGRSFPGIEDNGVTKLVDALKRNAFDAGDAIDATKVLRAAADKAYRQGDTTLGRANKAAADAIEDMLDRHLKASGNEGALAAFRNARALIAKTYSVQKGLNSETGSVSAQALAKQLEKGKPLSDELLTIAQASQAFPKATQLLKEAPKATSPLDWAVGGIGAASGNPMPALLMGARPLARNALLSKLVQEQALKSGAPAPMSSAAQYLLDNRLSQLLAAPVGTAAALNVGQ